MGLTKFEGKIRKAQLVEQPGCAARTRTEHAHNAGNFSQASANAWRLGLRTKYMDIGACIQGVANRRSSGTPGAYCFHHGQAGRLPVEQRRLGSHHYGVHKVAIQLDDFSQGGKIFSQYGLAANIQALRGGVNTGRLQRRCASQRVPLRGASSLVLLAYHGDAVNQGPMVCRGYRAGVAILIPGCGDAIPRNRRGPSGRRSLSRGGPVARAPIRPVPGRQRRWPPDASAAKAEDEEARPAPAGKLLALSTAAFAATPAI